MTANRPRHALLVAVSFALLASGTAGAQDSSNRYGSWNDAEGGVGKLLEELRGLVDEAERARAADPRFLRDLRDLAGRYDRPWQVSLLHDDFSDGDFTRRPRWVVRAGDFRVEPGWGLLSEVGTTAPAPATQGSTKSDPGKDLAAALIGGLLSQQLQPQQPAQPAPTAAAPASIDTRAAISNAFSLEVSIGSGADSQRLEVSLFQRGPNGARYVLAYTPGSTVPLELLRGGSRGLSVIDGYRQPLAGGADATRTVGWTRGTDGTMAVTVDGREMLRVVDRGLNDPFDGVGLTNHGGRFLVRQITVSGVR